MRVFGGALGLAIASSVMNNHLTNTLTSVIGSDGLNQVLNSIQAIELFPPQDQLAILDAFGSGYNLQFKVMIGFSAAQILAVALLYSSKKQIKVEDEPNEKEVDQGKKRSRNSARYSAQVTYTTVDLSKFLQNGTLNDIPEQPARLVTRRQPDRT